MVDIIDRDSSRRGASDVSIINSTERLPRRSQGCINNFNLMRVRSPEGGPSLGDVISTFRRRDDASVLPIPRGSAGGQSQGNGSFLRVSLKKSMCCSVGAQNCIAVCM